MRLSHRDFDALQRAILQLYEHREVEDFKDAVPEIILRIIPADYFVWNEYALDLPRRKAVHVGFVESERRMSEDNSRRMQRIVIPHPFTQYFIRSGDMTALKLSDFFTRNELRNSELYWEGYRPFELERELSGAVFSQQGTAAITVANRRQDFTERDRLIMNLLRPHFDQAHRNAQLRTARRAACARPLTAYELTPREIEIAHWLANGKTNPEIAIILQIRPRTVEKHVENILGKLGVENRTTAALSIASASGLTTGERSADGPRPQRVETRKFAGNSNLRSLPDALRLGTGRASGGANGI